VVSSIDVVSPRWRVWPRAAQTGMLRSSPALHPGQPTTQTLVPKPLGFVAPNPRWQQPIRPPTGVFAETRASPMVSALYSPIARQAGLQSSWKSTCECARHSRGGGLRTARRPARRRHADREHGRTDEPEGEDDPQDQVCPQQPHLGQILRGSRQKPGRKSRRPGPPGLLECCVKTARRAGEGSALCLPALWRLVDLRQDLLHEHLSLGDPVGARSWPGSRARPCDDPRPAPPPPRHRRDRAALGRTPGGAARRPTRGLASPPASRSPSCSITSRAFACSSTRTGSRPPGTTDRARGRPSATGRRREEIPWNPPTPAPERRHTAFVRQETGLYLAGRVQPAANRLGGGRVRRPAPQPAGRASGGRRHFPRAGRRAPGDSRGGCRRPEDCDRRPGDRGAALPGGAGGAGGAMSSSSMLDKNVLDYDSSQLAA
jgi:hypothetical protein